MMIVLLVLAGIVLFLVAFVLGYYTCAFSVLTGHEETERRLRLRVDALEYENYMLAEEANQIRIQSRRAAARAAGQNPREDGPKAPTRPPRVKPTGRLRAIRQKKGRATDDSALVH